MERNSISAISESSLIFKNIGDIMKDDKTQETSSKKKGTIETTIYCLNTKRKYIYELSGGEIVSERIVQETN
jgi:hypothetical protein